MKTAKTDALKLIEALPDDCTWEDIRYRVYVRAELELSFEDVRMGRVTPHEEVKREIREWLASTGRTEPSTTSV